MNTTGTNNDWILLTTLESDVPIQDFLCLVDLLKVSEELICSSLPSHLIQKYQLVKQLIFETVLRNRDEGITSCAFLKIQQAGDTEVETNLKGTEKTMKLNWRLF